MNRLGKGLRATGGVFVLLNIIIFFLPLSQRVLTNYPTKFWSQLQYVMNVQTVEEPFMAAYTPSRLIWCICLLILPLVLSALTGIWGILGDEKQKVSPILSFVILGLYIGLAVTLPSYFPNNSYSVAPTGWLNLVCTSIGAIISAIGLAQKSEDHKVVEKEIPQVKEMKKEQIESRYNIIENAQPVKQETVKLEPVQEHIKVPPYIPGNPRGVIVGLKGVYAGAEIALQDGERIRIGRNFDNDLIYDETQSKISRNHCAIRWDAENKEFLFWDESTNGSYANGSDDCLPKHLEVIVQPGTIIALGDESNIFRLE